MFPPLRQRSDARMNGTHPGGQARIARERVSLATNCEEPTRLLYHITQIPPPQKQI